MSSTGTSGGHASNSFLAFLTSILGPALLGALVAALLLFGLIYSQTQGPDKNPASQQILVYGE